MANSGRNSVSAKNPVNGRFRPTSMAPETNTIAVAIVRIAAGSQCEASTLPGSPNSVATG